MQFYFSLRHGGMAFVHANCVSPPHPSSYAVPPYQGFPMPCSLSTPLYLLCSLSQLPRGPLSNPCFSPSLASFPTQQTIPNQFLRFHSAPWPPGFSKHRKHLLIFPTGLKDSWTDLLPNISARVCYWRNSCSLLYHYEQNALPWPTDWGLATLIALAVGC